MNQNKINVKIFKKNTQMAFRQIHEDTLLVPTCHKNQTTNGLYTLNATASRIWQLVDGIINVESIAKILTDEYHVEFEEALLDAHTVILDLKKIGAICEIAEEN